MIAASRARTRTPGLGLAPVCAATALSTTWGLGLATQYVAIRLAFHPHLGPPAYRVAPAVVHLLPAVAACGIAGALALSLLPDRRWTAAPMLAAAASALALRHGALYSPIRVVAWYAAYRGVPAYSSLFAIAWVITGTVAAGTAPTFIRLAARMSRPARPFSSSAALEPDPVRRRTRPVV